MTGNSGQARAGHQSVVLRQLAHRLAHARKKPCKEAVAQSLSGFCGRAGEAPGRACLARRSVLGMLGGPVLGGCRDPGCAPEFEQVVGGGDQLPLGLAGV